MTSLLTDLLKFQSKRKFPNWEPKANAGTIRKTGSATEQLVYNCLAFVDLEVQVGSWITDVSDMFYDEAPSISAILMRNVTDEKKHDQAIRDLQAYYGYTKQDMRAAVIAERWKQLNVNPIVAAYALEMGIFFTILPLLMKHGDVYAATVASWINDDERVHVETNLRLMKHFGLKLTPEAVVLVHDTVNYIYQPIGVAGARQQADRAVRRLVTTKDPQMLQESLPITISYFEQNSNSDIVYS